MKAAPTPSILLIDGGPARLRQLAQALARAGLATVSATSAREVLAQRTAVAPALMLVDLEHADLPGPELLRRLQKLTPRVPFVILDGQGDARAAVQWMKQGALDYVIKDADFLQVVPEVVRQALAQIERETRHQREHAFISAVLDTCGCLVVVLDCQGRIVRYNRACERSTGYTFEEVRHRPFWEIFLLPDELEGVKGVFHKLCAGEFPTQHENHWLTKDGQCRLIAWSNTVLLDPVGAVEYLICTGIDITERKLLEREILEISDRERRRIGQDLHDGLCQHLAGTELMCQVLEQHLEKQAPAEAVHATEISQHVREAIGQTRRLARGLTPVTLESEGLMSALEELAADAERMFHVRCRFECPEPVRITNTAAATHLFRIAQEAVSNAIRHGQATQIHIRLKPLGDQAELSVSDNGLGLPKKPKKSGMGLRIMHYRAGMIGAALRFESGRGQGTTLRCSFKKKL